jgi:hypothetical protein
MARLTVSDLLNAAEQKRVVESKQEQPVVQETVVQETPVQEESLNLALDLESIVRQPAIKIEESVMDNLKAALSTGIAVNAVLDARANQRNK